MAKKLKTSKTQKAIVSVIAFLVLSLISLWKGSELLNPAFVEGVLEKAPFTMTVMELHKADAILIECGEKTILVDGGENADGQKVLQLLAERQIKKLDLVIATHAHSDHIGGLDAVLNKYGADSVLMSRIPDAQVPTNTTYTDFIKAITDKNIPVTEAKPMREIALGEMKLTVLAPVGTKYDNLNDTSVVVRLDYKSNSFLLTGDAEAPSEKDIMADPERTKLLDCDVLKVAHHGSNTSSTKKYIEAVTPEIALITSRTGAEDAASYEKVAQRLTEAGVRVYTTRDYGRLTLTADGEKIAISTSKKPQE
jgi:competence protein ComEC